MWCSIHRSEHQVSIFLWQHKSNYGPFGKCYIVSFQVHFYFFIFMFHLFMYVHMYALIGSLVDGTLFILCFFLKQLVVFDWVIGTGLLC